MKFWQKVPGKVKLNLKGLNVEKFLNHLISSGYNILQTKRQTYNLLSLVVYSKDSENIKTDAEKYGYKVEVVKVFGFYKVVDFVIKRFALVASLLLCLSVYLFSNLFVWTINIKGNSNITDSEILQTLAKSNIGIGKTKNNISASKVENILLQNFNQIALVSAYVYGNSLNINISEKLPQSFLEFSSLLSEYDGIVKSFTLVSGTANVKVGDVVRVGDILVYPYIIDNGGNKKSISAEANISIEVDFSHTISYNENREIYEDTGNKFVSKNISLGKLKFRKDKTCPYENYRKEVKESFVLNNMFLPIKKVETIYYEQTLVSKFIAFADAQDELIKEAYDNIENRAKGFEVLDKNHTIVKSGDIYYITATCKAMVYIGVNYDNNN